METSFGFQQRRAVAEEIERRKTKASTINNMSNLSLDAAANVPVVRRERHVNPLRHAGQREADARRSEPFLFTLHSHCRSHHTPFCKIRNFIFAISSLLLIAIAVYLVMSDSLHRPVSPPFLLVHAYTPTVITDCVPRTHAEARRYCESLVAQFHHHHPHHEEGGGGGEGEGITVSASLDFSLQTTTDELFEAMRDVLLASRGGRPASMCPFLEDQHPTEKKKKKVEEKEEGGVNQKEPFWLNTRQLSTTTVDDRDAGDADSDDGGARGMTEGVRGWHLGGSPIAEEFWAEGHPAGPHAGGADVSDYAAVFDMNTWRKNIESMREAGARSVYWFGTFFSLPLNKTALNVSSLRHQTASALPAPSDLSSSSQFVAAPLCIVRRCSEDECNPEGTRSIILAHFLPSPPASSVRAECCQCREGYTGDGCWIKKARDDNRRADGFFGAVVNGSNVNRSFRAQALCTYSDCNSQGTATVDTNQQAPNCCTCKPNVQGGACTECVDGKAPFPTCDQEACSVQGNKCHLNGTQTYMPTKPVGSCCACKGRFDGELCTLCADGYGPTGSCYYEYCYLEGNTCFATGTVAYYNYNIRSSGCCACKVNYDGGSCQTRICHADFDCNGRAITTTQINSKRISGTFPNCICRCQRGYGGRPCRTLSQTLSLALTMTRSVVMTSTFTIVATNSFTSSATVIPTSTLTTLFSSTITDTLTPVGSDTVTHGDTLTRSISASTSFSLTATLSGSGPTRSLSRTASSTVSLSQTATATTSMSVTESSTLSSSPSLSPSPSTSHTETLSLSAMTPSSSESFTCPIESFAANSTIPRITRWNQDAVYSIDAIRAMLPVARFQVVGEHLRLPDELRNVPSTFNATRAKEVFDARVREEEEEARRREKEGAQEEGINALLPEGYNEDDGYHTTRPPPMTTSAPPPYQKPVAVTFVDPTRYYSILLRSDLFWKGGYNLNVTGYLEMTRGPDVLWQPKGLRNREGYAVIIDYDGELGVVTAHIPLIDGFIVDEDEEAIIYVNSVALFGCGQKGEWLSLASLVVLGSGYESVRATVTIVGQTASMLGGVTDLQSLTMVGSMPCAGGITSRLTSSRETLSLFALNDSWVGVLLGNGIALGASLTLSVAAVLLASWRARRLRRRRSERSRRDTHYEAVTGTAGYGADRAGLLQALSLLRLPSLLIKAFLYLYAGTLAAAIGSFMDGMSAARGALVYDPLSDPQSEVTSPTELGDLTENLTASIVTIVLFVVGVPVLLLWYTGRHVSRAFVLYDYSASVVSPPWKYDRGDASSAMTGNTSLLAAGDSRATGDDVDHDLDLEGVSVSGSANVGDASGAAVTPHLHTRLANIFLPSGSFFPAESVKLFGSLISSNRHPPAAAQTTDTPHQATAGLANSITLWCRIKGASLWSLVALWTVWISSVGLLLPLREPTACRTLMSVLGVLHGFIAVLMALVRPHNIPFSAVASAVGVGLTGVVLLCGALMIGRADDPILRGLQVAAVTLQVALSTTRTCHAVAVLCWRFAAPRVWKAMEKRRNELHLKDDAYDNTKAGAEKKKKNKKKKKQNGENSINSKRSLAAVGSSDFDLLGDGPRDGTHHLQTDLLLLDEGNAAEGIETFDGIEMQATNDATTNNDGDGDDHSSPLSSPSFSSASSPAIDIKNQSDSSPSFFKRRKGSLSLSSSSSSLSALADLQALTHSATAAAASFSPPFASPAYASVPAQWVYDVDALERRTDGGEADADEGGEEMGDAHQRFDVDSLLEANSDPHPVLPRVAGGVRSSASRHDANDCRSSSFNYPYDHHSQLQDTAMWLSWVPFNDRRSWARAVWEESLYPIVALVMGAASSIAQRLFSRRQPRGGAEDDHHIPLADMRGHNGEEVSDDLDNAEGVLSVPLTTLSPAAEVVSDSHVPAATSGDGARGRSIGGWDGDDDDASFFTRRRARRDEGDDDLSGHQGYIFRRAEEIKRQHKALRREERRQRAEDRRRASKLGYRGALCKTLNPHDANQGEEDDDDDNDDDDEEVEVEERFATEEAPRAHAFDDGLNLFF